MSIFEWLLSGGYSSHAYEIQGVLIISGALLFVAGGLVWWKAVLDEKIEHHNSLISNTFEIMQSVNPKNEKKITEIQNTINFNEKKRKRKRLGTALIAAVIELILVFVGITGAGLFENRLDKVNTAVDLFCAKADMSDMKDRLSKAIADYQSGELDVESLILNAHPNFELLDLVINSDDRREHVPVAVKGIVFNSKRNICEIFELINGPMYNRENLVADLQLILFEYEVAIEAIDATVKCLEGGSREKLIEAINQINSRIEKSGMETSYYPR